MQEINVLEVLGKNLHDIRFKKNISMNELAKIVEIDIDTLMKFESGVFTVLSIAQYRKIAEKLGVSYDELTNGISFEVD